MSLELKPETLKKIDSIIPKYPVMRSAVLPLLHIIQEEKGYICKSAIEWVADKLGLQPINVFEVVTFYPMFRQEPIGKVHIKVCRTLSCALGGSYQTRDILMEKLACAENGTSPDGQFTVEFVECLANCGKGPVVQVDETMHEGITPEKAAAFADEIKKQATAR